MKFQVPVARRAALAKAVATATARRVSLRARYFDTADRRLGGAGLALRVRKEGRRWVQTLKGAGDGIWQRLEHEVPLHVTPGVIPPADPALHDGPPPATRCARPWATVSCSPSTAPRSHAPSACCVCPAAWSSWLSTRAR